MKPRIEVVTAFGGLVLLGLAVILVMSRGEPPTDNDSRRSTLLHGPLGSAGLADALKRLGVTVHQQRRRLNALLSQPDSTGGVVLAIIDPTEYLDRAEGIAVSAWPLHHGDLILAGAGADDAMSCFGYRALAREGDSVRATALDWGEAKGAPWVDMVLARQVATEVVDSGGDALRLTRCAVPEMTAAETLLVTPTGRAVALRLHPAGYAGTVTLVADGRLFANRTMRDTDAGVFALGLIAGRDTVAIFDERHHGFAPSGSLGSSALEWSRGSPGGWAAWQLVVVGLLVLLAGAIRFGPPRPLDDRRRRSALEHVTALATALSSAHGHDTAIRLLVRGMDRRLSPDRRSRSNSAQLLDRLQPVLKTTRGRAALAQLKQLTRPGQPAHAVRTAADAVEDVWQDLRP